MTNLTFGQTLQLYRNKTVDPKKNYRILSQERFGIEVDEYDRLTVYRWERDIRRIRADQRDLLCKIILVLYQYQGIKSREEADNLLLAGNYSPLTDEEMAKALPDLIPSSLEDILSEAEDTVSDSRSSATTPSLLRRLFYPTSVREDESQLTAILNYWLGISTENISHQGVLRFSIFCILWIISAWSWWLIIKWPYANLQYARQALAIWSGLCVATPLTLGLVIRADREAFLQEKKSPRITIPTRRMEGTLIGYQLGVAVVFLITLFMYYLEIWPLARWLIVAFAIIPLLSAYTSGRRLPINHYQAFENSKGEAGALHLDEGDLAFFIVFGIFPGALAALFYSYLDLFLHPLKGSLLIVIAITLLTLHEVWSRHRDPDYKSPSASFWRLILGVPFVIWLIYSGWEPMIGIALLAIYIMSALFFKQPGIRSPRLVPMLVGIFAMIIGDLLFKYNFLLGKIFGIILIVTGTIYYRRSFLNLLPFILVVFMLLIAVIIDRNTAIPIQWIRLGYLVSVLSLVAFQTWYNRHILRHSIQDK